MGDSFIDTKIKPGDNRYALALAAAQEGIWDWDLKTNKVFYSAQWKTMLGLDGEDTESSPEYWFERVHPDDIENLKKDIQSYLKEKQNKFVAEYRIRDKEDTYQWMLCRGLVLRDKEGEPVRFVGTQIDITDQKREEDRLTFDAMHDALTGLPNRALFMDRLKQAVLGRSNYAVLFMDLDHFKQINDTLGHDAGDELLTVIARRIEHASRAGDTISRFGGDEFCVLFTELKKGYEAESLAKRILKEVSKPVVIQGKSIFPKISIGIAIAQPNQYHSTDDIMRDADTALYEAKRKGRGRYEFYHTELSSTRISEVKLESALREAIKNGELLLHYHPIISLETGQITGIEALLRWEHPEIGIMPAKDFFLLAEETRLIIPIGEWALKASWEQFQKFQKHFTPNSNIFLLINVSESQIQSMDFLKLFQSMVKSDNLSPSSIQIEVGEKAIHTNPVQAENVLKAFANTGAHLTLDNFGTGYIALSYLCRFPFNAVKIDRFLIKKMRDNPKLFLMVKGLINIARDLDLLVTAEGVESMSELDQLRELGCTHAQGYVFTKPLPAGEFEEFLKQNPRW